MAQTLRLDPAQTNLVEVTAYNSAGLLAAAPYRIEIDRFGDSIEGRPKMHVLVVGVNEYVRKDWRLKHAATDATAVGDLFKKVAKGLYDEVKVTPLLNENATAQGIGAAMQRLAGR